MVVVGSIQDWKSGGQDGKETRINNPTKKVLVQRGSPEFLTCSFILPDFWLFLDTFFCSHATRHSKCCCETSKILLAE